MRRATPFRGGLACLLLMLLGVLAPTAAQSARADGGAGALAAENLNQRYRFPLSLGVEYQSLSPFAAYGSQFNIFDISATLRWPIPSAPLLQPALRAGMLRFDSQDLADPLRWDHTHWYGELGLVAAHHVTKNFEIAGELLAGASQAVFPNLAEAGTSFESI